MESTGISSPDSMPPEVIRLSACEAAAAISDGDLTSSTLVDACLARIAARDGDIKAFARLAADARERAGSTDRGAFRGVLHGVPVAITDVIDTAGLGTEYGSPIFAGHVPAVDANCVQRLKASGAIILGKTVTTEFANTMAQATRNPRDPTRTPGGSSGGSAAAVADFMVPVALGTQTGGSVILSASYCGLFGFKSSISRTDLRGVHELAGSLDTIGWLARDARDLSLLARVLLVLARPWPRVPKLPRLGRAITPFDHVAEPNALRARDTTCDRLEQAGAAIVSLELPASFDALDTVYHRIVSVEASRAFARYAAEHSEKLSPALTELIAQGRANEACYAEARHLAATARHALARLMEDVDALVLPAATGEAPIGLANSGDGTFNRFLSLLGLPSATFPAVTGSAGLPIGVQLAGRFGADEELLALVEWAAERSMKQPAP